MLYDFRSCLRRVFCMGIFYTLYLFPQNSWRCALRRQFKKMRQPLLQQEQVAEISARYGRPEISGRKRKHSAEPCTSTSQCRSKHIESQTIDADDSQLDIEIEDQSTSSDDSVDAGPTPAKLPVLMPCGRGKNVVRNAARSASDAACETARGDTQSSAWQSFTVLQVILNGRARWHETNRYAAQIIVDNIGSLKHHYLLHKWRETDSDEMFVMLRLLLHMGLVYKPRLSMYWSVDELFHTPLFSSVMPCNQFLFYFAVCISLIILTVIFLTQLTYKPLKKYVAKTREFLT